MIIDIRIRLLKLTQYYIKDFLRTGREICPLVVFGAQYAAERTEENKKKKEKENIMDKGELGITG